MKIDRRQMIAGTVGLGAGIAATAGVRVPSAQASEALGTSVTSFGVTPGASEDQTQALQAAIDQTAKSGAVLVLLPGKYQVGRLELRDDSILAGTPGRTILAFSGEQGGLVCKEHKNVRLDGLTLDGSALSGAGTNEGAHLIDFEQVAQISIRNCHISKCPANGVSLVRCSGHVMDSEIDAAARTGLFSIDATGLEISHNYIHDCANNGIQVWRTEAGEDGTIVVANRIEAIGASQGGSGQNGNGINVFKAGSVQVSGNRISDCVFTAVRGNAASNLLITNNMCSRLGEVAIYAEFGFEGTVISNNIVDKAATGISVTNFNEGGRMAVIQGNLIRNLFLREDERGVGIAVEADSMVSGNVIEGAPGGGIMVGWGKYLRDVNVTGNLVREARVGIGVSATKGAGYAYITNNMLSVTAEGGIRAMDHNKLLGPDLAKSSSESYRNMAVFGNVSL